MAHEYEVDVSNGGQQKTHKVTVEQHHEEWKSWAIFVGAVASTLNVAEKAIVAVRYLRKK